MTISGATYVKNKLQESDRMGKVEASAATLLSECSAILIRKLVASIPTPLSVTKLKNTIEQDDTFQCFRSALDDFQPIKLSVSLLSAHLKQQGRASVTKKRPAAKRKRNATTNKAVSTPKPSIAVKAMEDVEQEFVAQIDETSMKRGEVIEDEEDYD